MMPFDTTHDHQTSGINLETTMDDHMTCEEPGAIIAARREELGLTQAEVAARLGYGHACFISMMERGTSRMPLERVFDIARALGLDTG